MKIPTHLEVFRQIKQQIDEDGEASRITFNAPVNQRSIQLLIKGCIQEYSAKNYGSALEFYNQAIAQDSGNEEAFYRKGIVLMQKEQYDDASICFKNILFNFMDEQNFDAWGYLGDCEFKMQNFDDAFTYYSKANARANNNVLHEIDRFQMLFNKAKLNCILYKNWESAFQEFKQALYTTRRPSDKVAALKHLGFIKIIHRDFDKALQYFKKARGCASKYGEHEQIYQLWKAFCYTALGDTDRANWCLDKSQCSNSPHKTESALVQSFVELVMHPYLIAKDRFFQRYDAWRNRVDILWEYAYLPKYVVDSFFDADIFATEFHEDTDDCWFLEEDTKFSDDWRSFYGGEYESLEVFKNGKVKDFYGNKRARELLRHTFELPNNYYVTRIYAVQNEDLMNDFTEVTDELQERYPYYQLAGGNTSTKEKMDNYIHCAGFRVTTDVNYVPVLHGLRNPDNSVIWKASGVCTNGFQRVQPQDPGHFGKGNTLHALLNSTGLSFTTCADYALGVYCQANNYGEKVIIIGQAAVGRAYPCPPSGMRGMGCMPGYDAHYGRFRPRSNPSVEWDEWVFFDSRQVLPVYVVYVVQN